MSALDIYAQRKEEEKKTESKEGLATLTLPILLRG